MKIARVFPRITKATPRDSLTFFSYPPFDRPEILEGIDEVHISVAFTWDMEKAENLAYQWETLGVPVKIGGPAFKKKGSEFVPGMYLKQGYTITSRGCDKNCWFCGVPEREGHKVTEYPIKDGWNILDDNLLACSDDHIKAVFKMLKRQKHAPEFTGGIEPEHLKPWHCKLMKEVKTKSIYTAYDTPDDYEPLVNAGKMFREAGFTIQSHALQCYVLIGYHRDTFEKAEKRLTDTIKAGFMPYAMLYKSDDGIVKPEWKPFQREWLRKEIVATKMKEAQP
jgi:hypothetical protein